MQPVVEAVAAAVVISASAPEQGYFLPYLIAPALAAGLAGGAMTAVTCCRTGRRCLADSKPVRLDGPRRVPVLDRPVGPDLPCRRPAGGLGAAHPRQDRPVDPSYEEAYRLLSQLRGVSRQLAGGLDAISLAQALLESLATRTAYDVGAVFSRTRAGCFVPLAVRWRRASRVGRPARGTLNGPALTASFRWLARVHRCLLPMRAGGRPPAWWHGRNSRLLRRGHRSGGGRRPRSSVAAGDALLFGEVRSIATVEERRRLAREIHDGIAQELASLGLRRGRPRRPGPRGSARPEEDLQALRARADPGHQRAAAVDLRPAPRGAVDDRARLRAVRLRAAGRRRAPASPCTSMLDEAPTRLPVETETELLRIAQEAITNARKHAERREPLGDLPGRPATCDCCASRTTAAARAAPTATTASAWRSCGSAPPGSAPS